MKDSTTFHGDGKLSSAVEVTERPRSSEECEGSGTQLGGGVRNRGGWLASWLEARRTGVATVSLQAHILQWKKNWWESLDPTYATERKEEEPGLPSQASSQMGDTLSQRQGITCQLLETASITSSFSQWTLWTWQSYRLPPQTFMPFRVPVTSQRSSLTPCL